MQKNKAPIARLVNSNKNTTNSKKILLINFALLCASSGLVIANDSTDCGINPFYQDHPLLCAKPEIGVDFGFTRTQFKDPADKMFNRNQFPINFFFGFNITERFGIEVGYGETRRKHKQVTLSPNEFAPGADPVLNNHLQIYDTSLSISQPYIGLKYKYPISDKLNFFSSLGVTAMKINASWENIEEPGAIPPIPAPAVKARRSHSIETRKNIPFCKVGLYYTINNSFSLRFITTWSKTSTLESYVPSQLTGFVNGIPMSIKLKNSVQYSLGIVYTI